MMFIKSNIADVYDLITTSYISLISIVKIINNLNFLTTFIFINHIYETVLISGNNPIYPKLLNLKVKIIAKIVMIIFSFNPNLFL